MSNTSTSAVTKPVCAICQWAVEGEEAVTRCPSCNAVYHQVCWDENRGCAQYGCDQVPATEGLSSIEVPVSYWGQENKQCPACGKEILAAAMRCRHCGAVFESARPQAASEFAASAGREMRMASLRVKLIWFSALCIIPLTAPIGLLITVPWYLSNAADIGSMPGSQRALVKIAMWAGAVQLALVVLVGIISAVVS